LFAFGHEVCEPEGRAFPIFPMKLRFPLLTAITAVSLITATPQALQAKSDAEQICVSVGRLLEEGHYTHQQLNAEMSQKFLRNYLELLDFSHLFFTQKDVDALTAKYGTALADDVLLGNLKPAYEIYDLYQKRVDERVGKIKECPQRRIHLAALKLADVRNAVSQFVRKRCLRNALPDSKFCNSRSQGLFNGVCLPSTWDSDGTRHHPIQCEAALSYVAL